MSDSLTITLLDMMDSSVALLKELTEAYREPSISKAQSQKLRGLVRRLCEEAMNLP